MRRVYVAQVSVRLIVCCRGVNRAGRLRRRSRLAQEWHDFCGRMDRQGAAVRRADKRRGAFGRWIADVRIRQFAFAAVPPFDALVPRRNMLHCGKEYFRGRVGFRAGDSQVQRIGMQFVIGQQDPWLGDFAERHARVSQMFQRRFGGRMRGRIAAVMGEQVGEARQRDVLVELRHRRDRSVAPGAEVAAFRIGKLLGNEPGRGRGPRQPRAIGGRAV